MHLCSTAHANRTPSPASRWLFAIEHAVAAVRYAVTCVESVVLQSALLWAILTADLLSVTRLLLIVPLQKLFADEDRVVADARNALSLDRESDFGFMNGKSITHSMCGL